MPESKSTDKRVTKLAPGTNSTETTNLDNISINDPFRTNDSPDQNHNPNKDRTIECNSAQVQSPLAPITMQDRQGDITLSDINIEPDIPGIIKERLMKLLNEYRIVCTKKGEKRRTDEYL